MFPIVDSDRLIIGGRVKKKKKRGDLTERGLKGTTLLVPWLDTPSTIIETWLEESHAEHEF